LKTNLPVEEYMGRLKALLPRFLKWEYTGLCLLVLIVLILHLATLMHPSAPIFDEQYYIPDARSILQGSGSERIEHPPLGKLIVAGGILIFGDNPFGWRIFSVLFGLACIVFFYLICRQLKLSPRASFLATFLLALENLSFVQASVAMLDVYSLAFMLASFWLYLKGRHTLAGVSVGLAALAKLTGALALPVIVLHWLFTSRQKPWRFLLSMLMAPAAFLLLMPMFDLTIWHRFVNPFSELGAMWRASSLATFAAYPSPMLSRPWDWLLRPEILTYWVDPHYVGMISPDIWILIIPIILYSVYKALKGSSAAVLALAWLSGTYLFWIAASLISDRISYIFYFYPTIGAVCLGLGLWSERIFRGGAQNHWAKVTRLAIPLYLLIHLAAFVVLAPVSYWWKLPGCVLLYILARYELSVEPGNLGGQLPQPRVSPAAA